MKFRKLYELKQKIKEYILQKRNYMNTIKINSKNTKMIAHRGLSGIEAENTNAAFIAAGNRSYYGIETDIRKTKDGVYVANHDGNLKRIAGYDKIIEESTYDELRGIVLFDKDGRHKRNDLRIPTLEDYIKTCKRYDKQCVLELKSDFNIEDIKSIIDLIKMFDYLDRVTFISFYYDTLLRVRKIYPKSSVQLIFREITEDIIAKIEKDKFDVDIRYTSLTKAEVEMFHQLGSKINCWTVDEKAIAEKLIEMGVDFITSNILE